MLRLEIAIKEDYNEETQEFSPAEVVVLRLEHSLVSLSKWESIHKKPFLGPESKTLDETYSYMRQMAVDDDVPQKVFDYLTQKDIQKLNDYINDTMTATWISEPLGPQKPKKPQIVTSELIYSWMIAMEVPFECQYWHLSRLFTLIRVCGVQNTKTSQKINKEDKQRLLEQRRQLNEQRKQQYNTTG